MMRFWTVLNAWFEEHGRVLPWRGESDAYRIWLSEVILQQTRIEQGRDYYLRFVETYPTVQDLAAASEEEVLRLWQGLGYYTRARNMHAAARQVVEQHGGVFPSRYDDILALRGVGRYTAAAIASFAFGLAIPVIDGNVYRFIARLRGIATAVPSEAAYSEFQTLLRPLMPEGEAARFNAAIMDFGSLQCTPRPDCDACPFAPDCDVCNTGRVALLPVKVAKRQPKDCWFYYVELLQGDRLLLQQRTGRGIWKGLWQLPLIEEEAKLEADSIEEIVGLRMREKYGIEVGGLEEVCRLTHQLTHRTLHATFLRAISPKLPPQLPSNMRLATAEERASMPVSRLIDKYLRGV